jgi:uncharacterized protein (DUF2236 family)
MVSRPVSSSDLERLLGEMSRSVPNPREGVFGAASVNWKVNRESALFLAAGRAALLQLAHPWVANAIAQHSRTLTDPVSRFHHTFRVMFTMSFGSRDRAFAAARQLHRLHETIHGTVQQAAGRFAHGSSYRANDIDALVWVYATLIDSSLLAYELVLPALSDDEREQYYAESRRACALFGFAPAELPTDLAGFKSYMQKALQSDVLGVSESTRQLARLLLSGSGSKLRAPLWYQSLTVSLLPARLRDEFQFVLSMRDVGTSNRILRAIKLLYPLLPGIVRYVGPYHEALARLRGESTLGLAVRISNKAWVGCEALFPSPV